MATCPALRQVIWICFGGWPELAVVTVHRDCRSRHTSARCVQKGMHLPQFTILLADQQAPVDSAASGVFPVWETALLWVNIKRVNGHAVSRWHPALYSNIQWWCARSSSEGRDGLATCDQIPSESVSEGQTLPEGHPSHATGAGSMSPEHVG